MPVSIPRAHRQAVSAIQVRGHGRRLVFIYRKNAELTIHVVFSIFSAAYAQRGLSAESSHVHDPYVHPSTFPIISSRILEDEEDSLVAWDKSRPRDGKSSMPVHFDWLDLSQPDSVMFNEVHFGNSPMHISRRRIIPMSPAIAKLLVTFAT
jgi:hypothetical protein